MVLHVVIGSLIAAIVFLAFVREFCLSKRELSLLSHSIELNSFAR